MAFQRSSTYFTHLMKQMKATKSFSSANNLVGVAVNDKTGVATVTLQRPPVNGLNLELLTEFSSVLSEVEKNRARGMILTSGFNTVFSGGLDILEMYKPEPDRLHKFWTALQDVWLKLYGSSYPTVAAINGHAPAGGCLLALCCEYRVMQNGFTIGLNETQLGIVAPTWFIASMHNVIGKRQAELALTLGRLFTTDEALQVGMIDAVADSKEDAIAKSEAFLQKFAKVPPLARTLTKQSLRGKDLQALEKNRQKDVDVFVAVVTQDKVQKGLGIYLESLKKKKAN